MAVFKMAEIMDMGIEKEKKRRDFYYQARDAFPAENLKKLFGDLAKWEEDHVKLFSQIKQELCEEQETYQTYEGELADYIEAYLDSKLYYEVDGERFGQSIKTPEEALFMAMNFEKDAIIFFSELLNFIGDQHKETVKKLIKEEKGHLVYLHNMRKELGQAGV